MTAGGAPPAARAKPAGPVPAGADGGPGRAGGAAAASSVPVGSGPREVWRAIRVPILLMVITVLVVTGVVLAGGERRAGRLDPRATDSSGSRALAQILRGAGVDVVVATSAPAASAAVAERPEATTLLVALPDRVTPQALETLRAARAARVLLVSPREPALHVLAPGVTDLGGYGDDVVTPDCPLPEAVRAGDAAIGGHVFSSSVRGSAGCYPDDGLPSLVVAPYADGRDVVVTGSGAFLTNARLGEDGNASLAMQLTGRHPRLVWYLPEDASATVSDDRSLWSLVPAGWRFGAAQLALAAVVLALYRARRFGPVVPEPLPVAVRSTETVEGRARLYHRARAVDRAAVRLRTACAERLVPLLGLPGRAAHDPAAVVSAVAARTGRPAAEVSALLYGAVPGGEDDLVRLADDLDRLEKEVRST